MHDFNKRPEVFNSLLDTTAALIVVADSDGKIVRMSRSCAELGGMALEEAVGREVWEVGVAKEQRDALREVYVAASSDDRAVHHESDWIAPDGTEHTIEWRTTRVRHDDGTLAYHVSSGSDVSALKLASAYDQELAQINRELQRSNADLESFAAVASHDLQEPLRKIQAFGDRLSVRYADVLPERGQDYVERMQKAAARMSMLIQSLLAFSRVATQGQPFETVDLDDLVREVISDLDIRLELTGGQVEVASLPEIGGDPLQLRQLFQNLIGNALKFHREGVAPTVRITGGVIGPLDDGASDCGELDARSVCDDVFVSEGAMLCRIVVEDNGIGFDEKYLDRVFEVFQRLHGRGVYEGTGMGLAICRRIVERHRGCITAKSTPGEGSKFIITLPMLFDERTPLEAYHGSLNSDYDSDG